MNLISGLMGRAGLGCWAGGWAGGVGREFCDWAGLGWVCCGWLGCHAGVGWAGWAGSGWLGLGVGLEQFGGFNASNDKQVLFMSLLRV